MSLDFSRLLFALALSISTYLGTTYWYIHSAPRENQDQAKSPVAQLIEFENDVQRKPAKRLIWEALSHSDNLFSGESIRTNKRSTAKIQMLTTNAAIRLEPESLIVLREGTSGLELDFIEGNMFLKGQINVASGDTQILADDAEVALTRTGLYPIELQVLSGEAKLNGPKDSVVIGESKSVELGPNGKRDVSDSLQWISPKPDAHIWLNLSKNETAELKWKPIATDDRVQLKVGESRDKLKLHAEKSFHARDGRAKILLPAGRSYLQLIVLDSEGKETLSSSVIPVQINATLPPTALAPAEQVRRERPTDPLLFKWVSNLPAKSFVVQVASQADPKKVVLQKSVNGTLHEVNVDLQDGSYIWRVVGFLGKDQTPLNSDPVQFKLETLSGPKPPELIYPKADHHWSWFEIKNLGVDFKWSPSPETKTYKIEVLTSKANGLETEAQQETDQTWIRLPTLAPGQYHWRVSAFSAISKDPLKSETRIFIVDEAPLLEWAYQNSTVKFESVSPQTRVPLLWKKWKSAPPKGYRVRVSAENQEPIENWESTVDTQVFAVLPGEGVFWAELEAIGEQGQALAKAQKLKIEIEPKPLLPAPLWTNPENNSVTSTPTGDVDLNWQAVDGASDYEVELIQAGSDTIKRTRFKHLRAPLRGLKPGEYEARVLSVDVHNRRSPASEPKVLVVPDVSGVTAPTIKSINVR